MTEAQLQDAVIELAQLLGWRVAHFRPAQMQSGRWATPVQADGAGWPDLFMVKPGSELAPFAVELKSGKGRLRDDQRAWLDDLFEAGCYTAVWTPADWTSGRIEALLRTDSSAGPRKAVA